jgi:hypothetical protein
VGKADRLRRRAKETERNQRGRQQNEQRARQRPPDRQVPPARSSPDEVAERLIADAGYALLGQDDWGFRRALAQLTERPGVPDWQRIVDRTLFTLLTTGITNTWAKGWQPAEVGRQVVRDLGKQQARLVTDMVAAEMRGYAAATVDDRWQAQLSALPAKVWWQRDDLYLRDWAEREGADRGTAIVHALQVITVLHCLPKLQSFLPLPGAARQTASPSGPTDQKMLRRVRALLEKAESTEFPEEAEALTGRAQQLMSRYSIDAALLAAGSATRDEPAGIRMPVDNPYESAKVLLLQEVAQANRCRSIWQKQLGMSTVLGFPADLEAVELLFTSLLVQATTALVHAGSRKDSYGRSRTRSFRQSFLSAYAARIGERLRGATDEAVKQAATDTGRGDLLPVLAARHQEVDEAVTAMFSKVVEHSVWTGTDREGWASGRAAADLATLHARREVNANS